MIAPDNSPLGPETAPAGADGPRLQDRGPARRDALLRVEDLAAILGIGDRAARKLLDRGEVPSFRFGRRRYIRPEDLDRTIAAKIARQEKEKDAATRLLRGLPATPGKNAG